MTWVPGTALGPYVLEAPIGAGGMGEVWKARDRRVDRIVAIKRLRPEYAERFKREARAIAALNHPHICQLYDVGPDYLVMEYVDGHALRGPMPAVDAVRVASQIAEALEAAHRNGVIHRDLKPGNVLVGPNGAKLLDFGLAKQTAASNVDAATTGAASNAGAIVGTAAYMSPEQAQGQDVDSRSDVFSFGAVLYELLSGRRAFTGETTLATMAAVVGREPTPLEVSPALERVMRRCLAKQPRERFQAMTDVLAALKAIIESPVEREPSIAVLPFANMSRDPDDEYFSDGLAEEIINALAQIPGLKVIARTSAFAFKGQNTDIRRIADALNVTSVLEGSVRKSGSRIRVTAQLIAAADGAHMWSQRYDRELEDVFAVQDEIATAIARTLQVKLTAPARPYTPNVAAYEAFLRGRHHWARLTPESLALSRQCYEQAVALDPKFAAAQCALAEHFLALAANGNLPPAETMAQARAAALKALEIDPSIADAHAVIGLIAVFHDRDWPEAARRFRSAMESGAVTSRVRWFFGQYLTVLGRPSEAIEWLEAALRDDPLHVLCRSHLSGVLHASGHPVEASAQLARVLEIDPGFGIASLVPRHPSGIDRQAGGGACHSRESLFAATLGHDGHRPPCRTARP